MSGLYRLNISGNKIGNKGIKRISQNLKYIGELLEISLSSNFRHKRNRKLHWKRRNETFG